MWCNDKWLATGLWIVVSVISQPSVAEELVPDQQLPKLAEAAKDNFQPIAADEVARLKSDVLEAALDLERSWGRSAAAPEEGWRNFLKWDAMHKELAKDSPDLKTLYGFRSLYYEMEEGLELPEFRTVRDSLTLYMYALQASSESDLEEMYKARLDDLAKRLRTFQQTPSNEEAVAIGRTLGWLEQKGQADEVVEAVRRRYRQPNLMAQLSGRVMTAGFSEEIQEVQPVRDTILGTSIRGTARMNGEIGMRLVPDTERAALDILLTGRAYSRNVGYNGPVTIYSTGNTSISASKRVHIDASGFNTWRAVARCGTRSNISRIAAKCCMVRKIAWKRAGKSKSQAERIASSRAAGRVQRQFDSTASGMLGEANESFSNQFEDPLLRRDSFPNSLNFSTTDSHLFVELMRAGSFQLAPGGEPPQLTGDHDVAIRLHESLVSNFSEALIGGQTLTDEKLIDLLEQAEMEVPPELQIGPEKDPWSITFSPYEPIRASFSSDGVTVAIKGRQFSRGEQVIRANIQISATYKLEKTEKGANITRQGDVEVVYVGRKSLSVSQVAMKTFLRRKFNSLFEEDLSGEGLQLPGRWERAGRLLVRQLDSADGWLTLGWAHEPAGAPVAEADTTSASDQVAVLDSP